MAHSHADHHGHHHVHLSPPAIAEAGPGLSLFTLSAGARLVAVLAVLALLWAGVLVVISQ